MSHFSVMVFTNPNSNRSIADLLERFDENLPVRSVISKEDVVEGVRKDHDVFSKIVYSDYKDAPDSFFDKLNKAEFDYVTKTIPEMLQYSDEEAYQSHIKYIEEDDVLSDGSVVQWHNPEAKWDWYVIGGRFENQIPLKDGTLVDSSVCSEIRLEPTQEEIDKLKDEWNKHTNTDVELGEGEFLFYKPSYYLERYGDEDAYIKANVGLIAYAMLTPKGEWIQSGEMGLFGIGTDTADSEIQFAEKLQTYIKENPGLVATMIDCHI